jgi:hypothetical protein
MWWLTGGVVVTLLVLLVGRWWCGRSPTVDAVSETWLDAHVRERRDS